MRGLKKAFAAVALGTVGTFGGMMIYGATGGNDRMANLDQACLQKMNDMTVEYRQIANPSDEQAKKYMTEITAAPCMQELQSIGYNSLGAGGALGTIGFVAGLLLVGRKKKDGGPTPS